MYYSNVKYASSSSIEASNSDFISIEGHSGHFLMRSSISSLLRFEAVNPLKMSMVGLQKLITKVPSVVLVGGRVDPLSVLALSISYSDPLIRRYVGSNTSPHALYPPKSSTATALRPISPITLALLFRQHLRFIRSYSC